MYRGHFPPLGHWEYVDPPPITVADDRGRDIDLRTYGAGPVDDEFEALVQLYRRFDPEDRALGIPPTRDPDIREWLDAVLGGYCVVAWHGTDAVGQATLVPDGDGQHELAVFIHSEYQGAGIGHRLVEALLSYGRAAGVHDVWLVVERGNDPAVTLYRDVGFAVVSETGAELRMGLSMEAAVLG